MRSLIDWSIIVKYLAFHNGRWKGGIGCVTLGLLFPPQKRCMKQDIRGGEMSKEGGLKEVFSWWNDVKMTWKGPPAKGGAIIDCNVRRPSYMLQFTCRFVCQDSIQHFNFVSARFSCPIWHHKPHWVRKQIHERVRDRAQTANTNEKGQKILLIFAETTQTDAATAAVGELVNTKCKQHNFEVPNKLMAPSKFDAKIYISRAGTHARGRARRRRRWVGRKKPAASFYGVHKSKVTFICSWGLDQIFGGMKSTGLPIAQEIFSTLVTAILARCIERGHQLKLRI